MSTCIGSTNKKSVLKALIRAREIIQDDLYDLYDDMIGDDYQVIDNALDDAIEFLKS